MTEKVVTVDRATFSSTLVSLWETMGDHRFSRTFSYPTTKTLSSVIEDFQADDSIDIMATGEYDGGEDIIISRKFVRTRILVDHGTLWAVMLSLSNNQEYFSETEEWIREIFPMSMPSDTKVPISFWYNTNDGPRRRDRLIDVPTWSSVRINYAEQVRSEIDKLVTWTSTPGNGKLLLWHGDPGTGKTYAIRAVAEAWKNWSRVNYITDPEDFLGDAYYLMTALTEEQDKGKTSLFILEDSGELMSADARIRAQQSFARLLNLVEGFIGQGINFLALITTNEDLRTLHPALSRNGRCVSNVEFTSLSKEEAKNWAAAHEAEFPIDGERLLADLYAEKQNSLVKKIKKPMGFSVVR